MHSCTVNLFTLFRTAHLLTSAQRTIDSRSLDKLFHRAFQEHLPKKNPIRGLAAGRMGSKWSGNESSLQYLDKTGSGQYLVRSFSRERLRVRREQTRGGVPVLAE